MIRTSLCAALALALALPASAPARDQTGTAEPAEAEEADASGEGGEVAHPPNRAHAAWNAFHHMAGAMLQPEDDTRLVMLAWHAAMANYCPDIVLDHQRFGSAYARLEHADAASLSAEEHAYFRHHLAVNFGVAVGIILAEMAGTPEEIDARCAEVEAYAHESALGPVYFETGPVPAARAETE